MAKSISVDEANNLVTQSHTLQIFDLRDEGSYLAGHIKGAVRLTQENLINHVKDTEMNVPILVYCYHGISSEATAAFLSDQGFSEVYTMIGGFDAWRSKYETVT